MPFILQPAEFKVVQSVFQSLVEADWFDRTAANEKACTQLVLVIYKAGMTAEDLHSRCVDTAREIFGKPRQSTPIPSRTGGSSSR